MLTWCHYNMYYDRNFPDPTIWTGCAGCACLYFVDMGGCLPEASLWVPPWAEGEACRRAAEEEGRNAAVTVMSHYSVGTVTKFCVHSVYTTWTRTMWIYKVNLCQAHRKKWYHLQVEELWWDWCGWIFLVLLYSAMWQRRCRPRRATWTEIRWVLDKSWRPNRWPPCRCKKKSPFELTADPRMMEYDRAGRNWKNMLKKGSNFEDRGTR